MIISVNTSKILDSKVTESDILKEAYDKLMADRSPVNSINFMNIFKNCKKDTMLENLSYLYKVNTSSSINFLNMMIKTSDMDINQLTSIKESVINWFTSISDNSFESCKSITDCIDEVIMDRQKLSSIKASIQFDLDCKRISENFINNESFDEITMETSYLANDLEVIMYNINENPEVIDDFERIVRNIKICDNTKYLNSYPMLLESSTKLILNTNIRVTGDVLDLLTSIPTVIADKILKLKLNNSQIKSFIRIYDKQIAVIYAELKKGDATKFNILSTYLKKLIDSKTLLVDHCSPAKVTEGIADMQPEVGAEDIEVVTQMENDLEDLLLDFTFDDLDDDELMESFSKIIEVSEQYSILVEDKLQSGRPNSLGRASQKMSSVSRTIGLGVDKTARNVDRVTSAVDRALQPAINAINRVVNDYKKKDKDVREKEIISGQYQFRLARVIKLGIATIIGFNFGKKTLLKTVGKGIKYSAKLGGAIASTGGSSKVTRKALGLFGSLTGPLFAAIALYTAVALDKKIERRQREKILADLEMELKICEEKLEDAKSEGEREKKYELMRIKNRLEKDINRIKFNLK